MGVYFALSLQTVVILLSALAYGLPPARKLYPDTADSVGVIRLACLAFALGAVVIFVMAVAISNIPWISISGRRALAMAAVFMGPAAIMVVKRGMFANSLDADRKGFHVWAAFSLLTMGFSVYLASVAPYPGSLAIGEMGDHIEYSTLAWNLFTRNEYSTNYHIFDFYNNIDVIKESARSGIIHNDVINRLPFLPYFTSLYLLIFSSPDEAINHSTFIIAQCIFSALLSGALFVWITDLARRLGLIPKEGFPLLPFALAMLFYIRFTDEILLGFLEGVSIYYMLILLTLFASSNLPGRTTALALGLALLPLYFTKGEGVAVIGAFLIIFYIPRALMSFRDYGARALVAYAVPLAVFACAASPWTLSIISKGVSSDLNIMHYETACDGEGVQVRHDRYLMYTNERFGVNWDKCGDRDTPGDSPMDLYQKHALKRHAKFIGNAERSFPWSYSQMMGAQAFLVDVRDTPVMNMSVMAGLAERIAAKIAWRFFRMTDRVIGMWSYRPVIRYFVIIMAWLIFGAMAVFYFEGRLLPYLLFLLLFESFLMLLNEKAVYGRFIAIMAPFAFMFFAAAVYSQPLGFRSPRISKKALFAPVAAWAMVVATIPFMAAETFRIANVKGGEMQWENADDFLKNEVSPNAIVLASLPQYISGVSGKQAIGHSTFIDYLPGFIDNFRPDYILFQTAPNIQQKEYKIYRAIKGLPVLKDYHPAWEDGAHSVIILERNIDAGRRQ